MPSNLVNRNQLSRLGRWRLLRVTKKYRKLKPVANRTLEKRDTLMKKDPWAFQFLKNNELTRRKKGESNYGFSQRATKVLADLEQPWRGRAREMFSAQIRFLKADYSLAEAAEKRMIIKFGLQRVR